MTPSPAQLMPGQFGSPQAPTQAPTPQTSWWDYASQLPQGLPDAAYDGARDSFFNQHILPAAAQAGYDIEAARTQFMNATERPDKAEFPRLNVLGHQILESALSPFVGAGAQAQLQRGTEAATNEAARQGVNQPLPIIGRPMNFLGQAVGMAPYFGLGEGLAAPLLEAAKASEVVAGLGPIKEALHAATISTIQGAYDAASAQEGQKIQAFGKGAVSGAALGAGFELLGGLPGILRQAHDLTPEQAAGVQAVVRGNPTPDELSDATSAMLQKPEIADTVGQASQASIQAANKLGMPQDSSVDVDPKAVQTPIPVTHRRVKVSMIGADGQPYILGGDNGLDTGAVDQALGLISNHLANGAQIVSVGGARTSVQDFLRRVEKSTVPDEYKLPIRSLGDPSVPATMPVKTEVPEPETQVARASKFGVQKNTGDLGNGSWITSDGKVHPLDFGEMHDLDAAGLDGNSIRQRGNSIELSDLKNPALPVAAYEALKYNPKKIDVDSGELSFSVPREDIGEFLANPKKYARMQQGRASRKPFTYPDISNDYAPASWVAPNGIVTNLDDDAGHGVNVQDYIDRGYIRQRGNAIQANDLDQPNLMHAVLEAKQYASDGLVHIELPERSGFNVPIEDIGEFLSNPKKYARMNQGRASIRSFGDLRANIQASSERGVAPGYWISPEGEVTDAADKHAEALLDIAPPSLKRSLVSSIKQDEADMGEDYDDATMAVVSHAQSKGWIRTRGDAFAADPKNPNIPLALAHVDDSSGMFHFEDTNSGQQYSIPASEKAEFAANPVKWIRRNQGRASVASQSQINLSDIPHYDNFLQLPNGEVLNKVTGEVHDSLEAAAAAPSYVPQKRPIGSVTTTRTNNTYWDGKQWRPAEFVSKQTPIGERISGHYPGVSEDVPGLSYDTTRIYHPSADRATIVHERYHGLTSGLDMHHEVQAIMSDPTTEQLYRNVFDPETQAFYGDDPFIYREEVYAHSLDAVRTNNIQKIQQFIDGDTDRNTYMQWLRDKTAAHLNIVAEKPDSIYKRQYERLLNDVQNRATRNLDDIATYYSQSSLQPDLSDGHWATRDDSGVTRYGDSETSGREAMLQALEAQQPSLNIPELVDDTKLDPETPRFARSIRPPDGKPPHGMEALPQDLAPEPKQARGGLQLLSHYIRPFYAWLDTVAQRNSWPELYDAFKAHDDAQIQLNNFQKPFMNLLRAGLGGYDHTRQVDFFKWFQTFEEHRPKVEEALGFEPDELQMLGDLQTHVLDPLEQQFGVSLQDIVRGQVVANGADPVTKKLLAVLDPKQDDLLWQVGKYLETGARGTITDPLLDAADEVVNQRFEDKTWRAGDLRPILQRAIDYRRGVPDGTNAIVQGALEGAVELINKGFDKVNAKMPKSMQIPHIDSVSDDPLGKFTLFQYAGTLGLKPATLVRDGLQYFITTLPIAGSYAFTGLRRVFPALRMGSEEARDLWDTASRYGALIERQDLKTLYAASADEVPDIGQGKAEKFATWSLGAIQFSHNANRLAAFWGHDAQVADALDRWRAAGDYDKFNRDSGMWFMDKAERDKFNQEMANGIDNDTDFTHRAAARMVELSQWNMRRGASPGMYNHSLGRLFGQYGTWPLNYIEYARRFAAASDKVASAKALTTLAIAHGAILAAGQSVGIDSGRWTFTAPASDWQGGPLFQAALTAPRLADFETAQGDEARHNLREELFPGMLPGGDEAARIYEALATDDPNWFVKVLGFHAMQESDYNRGLHQAFPRQ